MEKANLKQFRDKLFRRLLMVAICVITSVGCLHAESVTVKGTVISASDGEPLIGVSVLLEGSVTGTTTDIDGNFTIKAGLGQTLKFSYVGMEPMSVKVTGPEMTVEMKDDSAVLDEVVVVGYGVQKKKLVTGATSQLKGDNVAKMNTTNPLQAMQGQAPGINITQSSGQPGKGMKVSIRGIGTVGNSGPLYLIDGVGGDINSVNPADIESIDILKDAASAAIYGAQAANGVVLVTTKSGKEGKATVSFDGYFGWQHAPRQVRMLNAREYMKIMDEQAVNSGDAPYDWTSFKSIYDQNGNIYDTDWLGAMIKDNTHTQNYTLGVSGGNAKSNYAISLGYTNQEGLIGGPQVSDYSRYNFRVNSNHKLFDNFLTVGEHVSFIHYKTKNMTDAGNGNNGNKLYPAFNTSPLSPIYSDNGYYGSPFNSTALSDWAGGDGNPYGNMMTTSQLQNKNTLFNGDVFASIEPVKNLVIKTLFAVSYTSYNYRSFTPKYRFNASTDQNFTKVNQSAGDGFTITWQNTASYNWNWGVNEMHALLGMETSRTDGFDIAAGNANLTSGFDVWDKAWVSNGNATTLGQNGISISGKPWDSSRNISYFARLGWNYDEKYMIEATFRADGSSKFAKGNRWGYFPSVSAGWNISNEHFMESTHTWLNFLKLRASWGRVGNNNVANYQYLAPLVFDASYTFGGVLGNGEDNKGYIQNGGYPSRLGNEKVKWETSEQTNVGIDARFLDTRLEFNFDFYIKTTKDWLVQAPILSTAGTAGPIINGGNVKNTGVELNIQWRDNIGKVNYWIGANAAYNHNRVGSIPTEDGIIHGATGQLWNNSEEFYRSENGHEIGYFWGYKTAGIFQNQKEIDDWIAAGNGVLQANPQPGDVKYVDINHDGRISTDDRVDLGSGIPDWTFGINLGFEWNGFDFSAVANGTAGAEIVQAYRSIDNPKANYDSKILGRWTGEGTSNKIPRVTTSTENWQFSDLYVHDADFLRISNITIGYDFAKLLKWKYISRARLYFQIQNLHTFTKYDGMDPEVGASPSAHSWATGIDQGYYPRPRTFLMGVNLTF